MWQEQPTRCLVLDLEAQHPNASHSVTAFRPPATVLHALAKQTPGLTSPASHAMAGLLPHTGAAMQSSHSYACTVLAAQASCVVSVSAPTPHKCDPPSPEGDLSGEEEHPLLAHHHRQTLSADLSACLCSTEGSWCCALHTSNKVKGRAVLNFWSLDPNTGSPNIMQKGARHNEWDHEYVQAMMTRCAHNTDTWQCAATMFLYLEGQAWSVFQHRDMAWLPSARLTHTDTDT